MIWDEQPTKDERNKNFASSTEIVSNRRTEEGHISGVQDRR
jgi:hypothetical protein